MGEGGQAGSHRVYFLYFMQLKIHHRTVFTVRIHDRQFEIGLRGAVSHKILKREIEEYLAGMPKTYLEGVTIETASEVIKDKILTTLFNTFY